MTTFYSLALALVAGLGIGLLYFGGLWLTVRHISGSQQATPLLFASFVARTALALLGFYLITRGHWTWLLASLAGFLLMRTVLILRWHRR